MHTHYDGQVSWDDVMDPSAGNGVTTIVMGNCGVGFAPVRPGGEKSLIELMEGVEDIPGTALYEGMEWGQWETFPDYLDYIAGREYSLDIGAQIAHGAVRYYVMGERGSDNEDATADDLAEMAPPRAGGTGGRSRRLQHLAHHRAPFAVGIAGARHVRSRGGTARDRACDEGRRQRRVRDDPVRHGRQDGGPRAASATRRSRSCR